LVWLRYQAAVVVMTAASTVPAGPNVDTTAAAPLSREGRQEHQAAASTKPGATGCPPTGVGTSGRGGAGIPVASRAPFEALSRIYPGEYGAEGEIEIRQVFEP
jgi:hypothetical protein